MDVKQVKDLKENLNQELYRMFRDFIQGGTIKTMIHDDFENLELSVLQEKPNGEQHLTLVETVFYFNVKEPNNINCKLNNRTLLTASNKVVSGIISDYSLIDLETMQIVKDLFVSFAQTKNLIEDNDGDGVGHNELEETTL
jgi:hypothetical protein